MREPFVQDSDFTLWHGDALEVLRELPDESVDCVATSPPFYALRDYGVEGQIGLEDTPDEWAARLVAVFAECRRVLTLTGTLWVECGDSYSSGNRQGHGTRIGAKQGTNRASANGDDWYRAPMAEGIKPKDLLGQPWLLAFALRADGWWLRQAIIWHKPNAMPESVTDRCTTAHSYVFLLSKQARYHFDAEAIAEPASWERWGDQTTPKYEGTDTTTGWIKPHSKAELEARGGRTTNGTKPRTDERRGFDNRLERTDGMKNARSVWSIPTRGYSEAHFATWPEALAERIIRAGCPERVCWTCGKPKGAETIRTPLGSGPTVDPTPLTGRKGMNRERRPDEGVREITKAEQRTYAAALRDSPHRMAMEAEAGPAFAHYLRTDDSGARPIPPDLLASWLDRGWLTAAEASDCGHNDWRPGTVLDPFGGSGTTALVARKHGRRSVLIELNEDYCDLAARRLQQLSLLAEPA